MREERTHPLLAQVPLTVSPFVTLPTAATLPYTYKPMPSALPPSTTGVGTSNADSKPQYVVSPQSGHAAHPEDIIASCRALQAHITRLQESAEKELRELDERIKARELAEKRRVAPGWLDSEARLLEPERKGDGNEKGADVDADADADADADDVAAEMAEMNISATTMAASMVTTRRGDVSEMAVDQGEELDRAFGGLR
ncbi:hypothetical protein GGR50DRAFT_692289 [Xylaria sp. CBS 124048]|nr:hypothetical protein GGR50DRAFT_692289 [Xylaria sp. CBS 124048]